jgi:hypothetical protein
LEIFDGVSYDPELYVMTMYGFEGEDFTWSGEPYNSYIEQGEPPDNYLRVYTTETIDGNAGKAVYTTEPNALSDYSKSYEAKAMNLTPYKSDPERIYADEEAALRKKYNGKTPYTVMERYYLAVASGEKRVGETWDDYMEELEKTGLEEYTDLINKYPAVSFK